MTPTLTSRGKVPKSLNIALSSTHLAAVFLITQTKNLQPELISTQMLAALNRQQLTTSFQIAFILNSISVSMIAIFPITRRFSCRFTIPPIPLLIFVKVQTHLFVKILIFTNLGICYSDNWSYIILLIIAPFYSSLKTLRSVALNLVLFSKKKSVQKLGDNWARHNNSGKKPLSQASKKTPVQRIFEKQIHWILYSCSLSQ